MVVPVPFRPSPMGPPLLAVASDALAVLASLSADRPHGVARALGRHHMMLRNSRYAEARQHSRSLLDVAGDDTEDG